MRDLPLVSANTTPLTGSRRFRLRAENVPGGLLNPIYHRSVSPNTGVEPATVSNNISGVTRHVASWSYWDGTGYINQAGTTSNLTSSSYTPMAVATLNRPAGYSDAADAWLSQSVFADGISPRRIYVTGVIFNRDANGVGISPSAIRTWGSYDGGLTWNGGWNVDERAAGAGMVDKPATDVSSFSGTRGYFYAAYTDLGAPQRLIARRNANGVIGRCNAVPPIRCYPPTFTEAVITTTNNPHGAQVVVNPTNGNVYVLWYTQTSPSTIRMRRSLGGTMTFETGEIIVANGFSYTWDVVPGIMRSPTLPHARFNPITNRLMLTWHGSDSSSQSSAIYYTNFDPDALTPTSPVPTRMRIDAFGHQHQPALDSDDFGNALITYYSNQNDGANRKYQLYGVYVTPSNTIASGPALLNATASTPTFVGDYRDTFYWTSTDSDGTRWNTTWTPSASFETLITGVK